MLSEPKPFLTFIHIETQLDSSSSSSSSSSIFPLSPHTHTHIHFFLYNRISIHYKKKCIYLFIYRESGKEEGENRGAGGGWWDASGEEVRIEPKLERFLQADNRWGYFSSFSFFSFFSFFFAFCIYYNFFLFLSSSLLRSLHYSGAFFFLFFFLFFLSAFSFDVINVLI